MYFDVYWALMILVGMLSFTLADMLVAAIVVLEYVTVECVLRLKCDLWHWNMLW